MSVIRRALERTGFIARTAEEEIPLASTSTWSTQIAEFWSGLTGIGFSPQQIERVWVANRCIEINAQQIAAMPLRFHGAGDTPAWVANPDPVWYPNGIGEAVFSIVWSMYAWGDAFLYVTSRYASGFPRAWTVLDPATMTVEARGGRRRYRSGEMELDWKDMVQISRNPRGGLRGTPAFKAYASQAYGLLAASDLGRVMMAEGAVPNAVLKTQKRLTEEQASALQRQWVERTAVRRGAPAVLPPDVDFEQLAFSPNDLLLLDAQQFNAQILASALSVPALFLNLPIEGGLNYQSPAMLGEHWWRFELSPIADRIADALSGNMLAAGNSVTFDARRIIAPTWREMADALQKMAEKGQVTPELLQVLLFGVEPGEDVIQSVLEPTSAGASPAQQPSEVVPLRPTAVN